MPSPDAVYEIDFPHDMPTWVLARFAGIDTDAYTNFVASIMLRDFQLPINGQRHISAALTNIPMFVAADERLQFGWGDQSMMRSRYIHAKGYEHAAIMVALSSTFHEAYAAEVLHAMAVLTAGPEDMVPHIKQWVNIVRAGNGSFTPCGFDVLVEDLIRHDPYCVGPGSNLRTRRCHAHPKAMAKALVALSKITSKKEKQLTLVGGAVIAWFAAIGEYFYDLRVSLRSCGGVHLYGEQSVDDAQLVLFYRSEPDLEIQEKSVPPQVDEQMEEDNLAYSRHVHYLPFGGRVEWPALLPKVFGRAYHHLDHEEAHALDTAIGTAARCIEDATIMDSKNEQISLSNKATAESSGLGLIKNITAWLPELQRGQGRMERQLRKTPDEAGEIYCATIDKLRDICQCSICSISRSEREPKDGYCLPVIVETVIALGLAISRLIVTKALYPSRQGVQGLYQTQVEKRKEANSFSTRTAEYFKIIYGNEWNASNAKRLQNAAQLFSGTIPKKQIPESIIGIAHEGICVYLARVERSDNRPQQPGKDDLIRVVSGAIYAKSKLYNRISLDPVSSEEEEETWSWEEHQFDHWSTPLYFR